MVITRSRDDKDQMLDTESDYEERPSKIREDSPFYPSGVRFSPSVKSGSSPYGRRTRSGGRSNMTSYLQGLVFIYSVCCCSGCRS